MDKELESFIEQSWKDADQAAKALQLKSDMARGPDVKTLDWLEMEREAQYFKGIAAGLRTLLDMKGNDAPSDVIEVCVEVLPAKRMQIVFADEPCCDPPVIDVQGVTVTDANPPSKSVRRVCKVGKYGVLRVSGYDPRKGRKGAKK